MKSTVKIQTHGEDYATKYTCTERAVGQSFMRTASVKIGERKFVSREVPHDNYRAAYDSLLARVQEVYPEAKFAEVV